MKFPVDLLADVSQAELERLADNYVNNLLYSNPDCPDRLALSDSTQVIIDISSVGFVPLYGSGDKQKILALFSPSNPHTVVALYLLDRWWTVDDILKTADPTRGGAVEVETLGERVVLYILNRVVYRAKEMSPEELPFLCHGDKDNAKILWNDGEAVGFYSVKPTGSFRSPFSTVSYQLPVMDAIFVRKCRRGKGFGLQMLEDFVLSFKEDYLGLRYPLTHFMYKVCEKYLRQYPGDTDLLWEVESIGGPTQRTNIARKIQAMDQRAVSKSLTFTEESLVIPGSTERDVVTEATATQIKETGSMECTVEIVEEVTVLSVKVSEAEVPLTARGRSSGLKRRKIREDKSEKVIRIEDLEAESPSKDQGSAQQKTELRVSELAKTEGMSSVALVEQREDVVDMAPDDAAKMVDQPATVLARQDLEEADVTLAPTTEEPQVVDDSPQNLNNASCDSQITVENVASQIEEECPKEDTAALAVAEEALEEAETLDKAGEGTQVGVTDEKSEDTVTQQEPSLSTRATLENGEAGKTGRANVEAVATVQSVTPRRRYTRHSKHEEGLKDGIILRGRTLMNTPPLTRKYTRHSQKVSEELEKEVDEVEEEKDISTTQVVEESAPTEGEAQEEVTSIEEDVVTVEELLEDEQLKQEEKTETRQEPGVEDNAVAKEDEDAEEREAVAEQRQDAEEVITGLGSDLPTEGDGGKAPEEDQIEEANEDPVTAEVEKGESEDGTMTEEKEDTSGVTAAADDLVQEETDASVPSPPTDSVVLPPVEEEATPSAEEDVATQLSDRRRVTVVLVDLQKPHHDVQEEAAATEEGLPVQKTAAGAEVELATIQDSGEGRDEETAKEEEGGEESTAVAAEEEEQQMTDQEKEERLEERDATEQVENIEAETTLEKEDIGSEQGQDAIEDKSEGISKTSAERQVDASGEEFNKRNPSLGAEDVELPPVAATRSLRSGGKMSKAPPKTRSRQSKKQSDEEEEEKEEEEPPVETRILKRGRKSVRISHKRLQKTEEGPEESVEEAEVQEEEDTGSAEDQPTGGDEGKAPEEDKIEVENEGLVTAEVEKGESEEGIMTLTEKEENTETDASVPSPPTDSVVLPPVEEEATPSAEEQQSENVATQLSDRRRVTVVLVDLQKPHHDVEEEAAATEEGLPVQKTAAEAEETMKEEKTVEQENVTGSPVGIEKNELEKVMVEEEQCEDKVEAVTKQDTEDGRNEETAKAVQATPRTRGRPRKVRKEAASKIQKEEPAVQVMVLRTGRKSIKRTRKQLQEEGGEESTAVEAREEEEEQQMTDQEKEESLEERDATEQVENTDAETALEKEDTVAEEAVNQHDAQEEGQVDSTETVAEEDTEASVEQHDDEENTLVVAEEAVSKQDTVEGEQSTSTSEVAESAQETMLTAKDEQAKDASEEEAPVVQRVLRSGEKTVRAATRSKTTKKHEEEAPGEEISEEDEPAVEIRVLRKGRKPTDATPRRKSKRARTQCQTEEEEEGEGEEEATPTEEIEEEEEEEAGQESPEEKGIKEMEEEAHNAAGEDSTVGDAEQTKEASTAEAGVLEEEENSVEAVDGTGTDTVLPSSVEAEETNSAVEEETAVVEQPTAAIADKEAEEDAPTATTRAFRGQQKASPATPPPRSRRQKDDSPRRSVRKRPKVDYRENEEGERDETEGHTDQEGKVTVASDEDRGNKKSECSSDADEVVEAASSSQEGEEYEQNVSEEEEEPIVIGTRVLRGRSVPSLIITPLSKTRRHNAKVSNEEKRPRSAQKRKSTEVRRKSKRLSRV